MQLLAGFFSLVFFIVNPTMYFKVLGELVKLAHSSSDSPFKPAIFRLLENITTSDESHCFYIVQISIEWTLCVIHVVLSLAHAYGCFTSRPAFIRPMLANCFASTGLMLIYVMVVIYIIFNVNVPSMTDSADAMRFETTQKRNLTTAGIFFVLYILWDASTLYVYFEVKQQHDDFMYWIVEERIVASQTRSTDRSPKSSKFSKGSKISINSPKIEENAPLAV